MRKPRYPVKATRISALADENRARYAVSWTIRSAGNNKPSTCSTSLLASRHRVTMHKRGYSSLTANAWTAPLSLIRSLTESRDRSHTRSRYGTAERDNPFRPGQVRLPPVFRARTAKLHTRNIATGNTPAITNAVS